MGQRVTGPTAKARAVKARKDAAYAKTIRDQVQERDELCRACVEYVEYWTYRIAGLRLEWCHMEGHRRFETRGLPPEQRHSTTWTLMLCAKHHADYDARRLHITGNADGPLEFTRA